MVSKWNWYIGGQLFLGGGSGRAKNECMMENGIRGWMVWKVDSWLLLLWLTWSTGMKIKKQITKNNNQDSGETWGWDWYDGMPTKNITIEK